MAAPKFVTLTTAVICTYILYYMLLYAHVINLPIVRVISALSLPQCHWNNPVYQNWDRCPSHSNILIKFEIQQILLKLLFMMKFCNFHNDNTVMTCAKFLWDRLSTFQTRVLHISINLYLDFPMAHMTMISHDHHGVSYHCQLHRLLNSLFSLTTKETTKLETHHKVPIILREIFMALHLHQVHLVSGTKLLYNWVSLPWWFYWPGAKPLPEPVLANMFVTIWPHMVTMSWDQIWF